MFEVKKSDLLYGYISYFFKYSSNILVLPFVVSNLNSSEYAIWNIFLAVSSFVVLFDLGYGLVIQRYVMYAYSGVDKISEDTLPQLEKNSNPNYILLYQMFIASKKIYRRISVLSGIVLIFITPYIIFISRSEYTILQIIVPWLIFSVSIVINMYILSDATIIKGLGLIGELQRITLINSVFSTLVKIAFLEFGLGMLGLSLSFFLTSLLLAYQYFKIVNVEKNKDIGLFKMLAITFSNDFKESFEIIKERSKGMGGVLISNFLQNQLFTIVAPIFISLEIMAKYSLTWQLISIVASLSGITFSMYTMKMGNYIVSNKVEELRELFSITITIFLILYTTGSIIAFTLGSDILTIIGSKTGLLSNLQIFLIVIFVFVTQINQKMTNILSLSNNQSFVKSLIMSSFFIASLNLLLLILGFGITEVLISAIIIQSSYNLWKWTIECMKLCNVNFTDFYILPYKKIIKEFNNRKNKL